MPGNPFSEELVLDVSTVAPELDNSGADGAAAAPLSDSMRSRLVEDTDFVPTPADRAQTRVTRYSDPVHSLHSFAPSVAPETVQGAAPSAATADDVLLSPAPLLPPAHVAPSGVRTRDDGAPKQPELAGGPASLLALSDDGDDIARDEEKYAGPFTAHLGSEAPLELESPRTLKRNGMLPETLQITSSLTSPSAASKSAHSVGDGGGEPFVAVP